MIKMNETVKDNLVTMNNVSFFIDDALATKIYAVLKQYGTVAQSSVAQSTQSYKATSVVATEYHKVKKPFKAQYEIKEQTAQDGTKLFCISRANGWTRSEKNAVNKAIKALPNIKTIQVPFTDKNGKLRTFDAWGYNTKTTATKYMKTLPEMIEVEYSNSVKEK